jgi:hypothetical protein
MKYRQDRRDRPVQPILAGLIVLHGINLQDVCSGHSLGISYGRPLGRSLFQIAQMHFLSEAAKKYTYILGKPYRWESWAAPKDKDGKLDHSKALTGDDLRDFVDGKLFPYLHSFKRKASGPNTLEYKIGEIFDEIKNKIQSGYNLREIIVHIDELRFRSRRMLHYGESHDKGREVLGRSSRRVGRKGE